MPCFNSTLVQLKVFATQFFNFRHFSFNSTLVQLKVILESSTLLEH